MVKPDKAKGAYSKVDSLVDVGSTRENEDADSQGQQWTAQLRQAIFDTMYDLSQDTSIMKPLVWVLWIFDLLQMLILPLNPRENMPWSGQPAMQGFLQALTSVNFIAAEALPAPLVTFPADTLWLGLNISTLLVLTLFAWMVWNNWQGSEWKPKWRLKLVRLGLRLIVCCFWAPITGSLFSPYHCQERSNWLNTNITCWSGSHVGFLVGSSLLLPVILSVGCCTALMFINRASDSTGKRSILNSAHGRVHAAMLVMKAALVGFEVLGHDLTPWAHAIVYIIGGIIWVWLYGYYMPYAKLALNQLQCSLGAIFLGASVACVLSLILGENSGDAGTYVWFFMIPTSIFSAVSALQLRFNGLASENDLNSPFLVELKVRSILAASGKHGATSAMDQLNHLNTEKELDLEGGKAGATGLSSEAASAVQLTRDTRGANVGDGDWREKVEATFQKAFQHFSASAWLDLFYADYVGSVLHNRHLERVHLKMAATKIDVSAVDIQYFVQSRRKKLQEIDENASLSIMTVEKRVSYESLMIVSASQVMECRQLVQQFWDVLAQKTPELGKLQRLGVAISDALSEAHVTFKELRAIAPQSAIVMRQYAEFLLEVANDPRHALELLNDAEQIEEEQTRARTNATEYEYGFGSLCEFDLSVESLALMTVSSEIDNLGAIMAVNLPAQKLLGYNPRELLGRDVSSVIPEPIAAIHHVFLEQYLHNGQVKMTSASRVMLALHRNGYMMPVKMNISPSTSGDEWSVVMEEITTSYNYVLFSGSEQGYRVYAVCKRGQTLLGADTGAVRAGGVSMGQFIDDMDRHVQLLSTADSEVIRFRNIPDGAVASQTSFLCKLQRIPLPVIRGGLFLLKFRATNESMRSNAAGTSVVARTQTSNATNGMHPPATPYGEDTPIHTPNNDEDANSEACQSATSADNERANVALCPVMGGAAARLNSKMKMPAAHPSVRQLTQDGRMSSDPDAGSDCRLPQSIASAHRVAFSPEASPLTEEHIALPSAIDPTATSQHEKSDPPLRIITSEYVARGIEMARTVSADHHMLGTPTRHEKADTWADDAPVRRVQTNTEKTAGSVPGKAGSVQSKGSRGSGASADSVTAVLRRGVALSSHRMEKSLIVLSRSVLLVFLIPAIMNVVSLVVTRVLFDQMVENLGIVLKSGQRGIAFQKSYVGVQMLNLASDDFFDVVNNGSALRTRLLEDVATFEAAHQWLYMHVDSQIQAEVDLYTVPNITIEDLVPGTFHDAQNYSATKRVVNLANAGVEVVAKARRIAAMPLEAIKIEHPDVFFMIFNTYSPIRNAMNESMLLSDQRSATQGAVVTTAAFAILATALIMFTVVTAVVILPSVFKVMAAKQQIMDTFLEVPLNVIRALRNKATKKLERLRRAQEEAEMGIDVADDEAEEEDIDAIGKIAEIAQKGKNAHLAASEDDDDEVRDCWRCCRCKRADTATRSVNARRYKKSSSHTWKMILAMTWPIMLYMAYFIGTHFWRMDAVDYSRYAKAEVLWSNQAGFWMNQVFFNARIMITRSEPEFVMNQNRRAKNALMQLEVLTDDLLYGNAVRGTRAGLQTSPDTYNLFMKNGCVENRGWYYNMTDCVNFHDGILAKTGLLAGIKDYLASVRHIVALIDRDPTVMFPLSALEATLGQAYSFTYLPPAFERAAMIRYEESVTYFSTFATSNLVLTVCSILALFIIYMMAYSPLIRGMDADIKHVRMLLLLFPDEVARFVPAIVTAGREMIKNSNSSVTTGTFARRSVTDRKRA